jgi:hypothetical protein
MAGKLKLIFVIEKLYVNLYIVWYDRRFCMRFIK